MRKELTVQLVLRDEIVAADVGDKLLGNTGVVAKLLAEALAKEIVKSDCLLLSWDKMPDPSSFNNVTRVRADVIVERPPTEQERKERLDRMRAQIGPVSTRNVWG